MEIRVRALPNSALSCNTLVLLLGSTVDVTLLRGWKVFVAQGRA